MGRVVLGDDLGFKVKPRLLVNLLGGVKRAVIKPNNAEAILERARPEVPKRGIYIRNASTLHLRIIIFRNTSSVGGGCD